MSKKLALRMVAAKRLREEREAKEDRELLAAAMQHQAQIAERLAFQGDYAHLRYIVFGY